MYLRNEKSSSSGNESKKKAPNHNNRLLQKSLPCDGRQKKSVTSAFTGLAVQQRHHKIWTRSEKVS
jgi:hypothetical protein